jgi:hypothetical protein
VNQDSGTYIVCIESRSVTFSKSFPVLVGVIFIDLRQIVLNWKNVDQLSPFDYLNSDQWVEEWMEADKARRELETRIASRHVR